MFQSYAMPLYFIHFGEVGSDPGPSSKQKIKGKATNQTQKETDKQARNNAMPCQVKPTQVKSWHDTDVYKQN